MKLDDLVKLPGAWLSRSHDTGIIVSSRVRLARNLKGHAFPAWAGPEECKTICEELIKGLARVSQLEGILVLDMGTLDRVDKQILKERQLISQEMAARGSGSALVVSPDESVAIMVNEEDHLRLQAMSPGLDVGESWKRINRVDNELERSLEYAFSSEFGYLTACPTNVGTGLRASVMVHLPGLKLLDEVDPIIRGLNKIGLTVRGVLGEGSEAWGQMYQISNQRTLGESEEDIMERLSWIVSEIVEHEENARHRLVEDARHRVLDAVGRAYGVLNHAYMLSSRETMDLLSDMRLGIDLGFVKGLGATALNELMLLTQPGHLQKMISKGLGSEERDHRRAEMIRKRMAAVTIQGI